MDENLEFKKLLNKKLSVIEMGIPYLKAEGNGKNGKSLELNSILSAIKESMHTNKIKLISEIINYETSTITKKDVTSEKDGVNVLTHQLVFQVDAELGFTFMDFETGYEEERRWFGSWSSFDNTGFAGGGLLTYFKRQFLMHEFNIESDEITEDAYIDKNRSPEDKAKNLKNRLEKQKQQCILDLEKATTQQEIDFAWSQIDESLRLDENLGLAYANSFNTIYEGTIKNATKCATLVAVKAKLKELGRYTPRYDKLLTKKDKELKDAKGNS